MGLAPRLRRPLPATYPVDFNVYYSAGSLVRTGQANQLYTGADTGTNPQKLIAPASSPIYRAARAAGLPFVGLYVYPPLLADLMWPLSALPVARAARIWLWLNFLFLGAIAAATVRLLRLRWWSWGSLAVLVGALCSTPTLQCLHDGQITVLLLLLWTLGVLLYREEHTIAAAMIFALAAALKLTPALVLLPCLLWRQWRFVGAFAGTIVALTATCLWLDSAHTFAVYFSKVLPAMAPPVLALTNFSLPAATARLVLLFKVGAISVDGTGTDLVNALRFGRVLTYLTLLALLLRMLQAPFRGRERQAEVLGLLALLAPVLSPVSWFHAYATAFLSFALLWHRCLQPGARWIFVLIVAALSLLLVGPVSENLLTMLAASPQHAAWAAYLQFGQLLAACALVLYQVGAPANDKLLPPTAPL